VEAVKVAKLQTLGLLLRDTIQVQLDALEREGITGPIKVEDSEINWNPRGDVFIFRANFSSRRSGVSGPRPRKLRSSWPSPETRSATAW
jgi:hypothetical protein